jgi:hypothetical protein
MVAELSLIDPASSIGSRRHLSVRSAIGATPEAAMQSVLPPMLAGSIMEMSLHDVSAFHMYVARPVITVRWQR